MQSVQGFAYVPGRAEGPVYFGPRAPAGSVVVVTWGELAQLTPFPAAVIVVEAAPLSHAMIRLFSLARPVVCIDRFQAARLEPGAPVMVDGSTGRVVPASSDDSDGVEAPSPPAGPIHTADGIEVALRASVSAAAGAGLARQRGARSIGLVRAEYLAMGAERPPDRAMIERALSTLCQAADPLPVTVRLSDYGSSKWPSWLKSCAPPQALGLQGVRWFDREPVESVIAAQLQAIRRLSRQWKLRVLLPFVTLPEEGRRWCDWARTHVSDAVPVGIMAESPAAVLALAELQASADFVGIGCNDLLQGLFEADRDLPEVRHLLDPYAPAVYRLLRFGIESVRGDGSDIQLCGLLPQLPGALPVLLGLGYRTFSVEPLMLPWLAQTIQATDTATARKLAQDVCEARDGGVVRHLLHVI